MTINKPIPVRFTQEQLSRADRLAKHLTRRAAGALITRSEVLRLACERGLVALEAEVPWNAAIKTSPAEAEDILRMAMEAQPRLTPFGLGVDNERRKRPDAIANELQDERAKFPGCLAEVAAAADVVKKLKQVSQYNKRHTSYGCKHMVERWFNRSGHHIYVSNGSFIAAAIGCGCDAAPVEDGSPNMYFKFSERSLKAI